MKTLTQIKKEITDTEKVMADDDLKPAAYKRMKKKVELLKELEKYLQTSPTKEYVERELERLETIITSKTLEFQRVAEERKYDELAKKEVTELKKKHESQYDIPKFRIQVRALRFLTQ